jgi:hypothetical protein
MCTAAAMKRMCKQVSLKMNSCNNIRTVFSVQSVPRGYKKDKDHLRQLSFKTPASQDVSLEAEDLN